MSRYTSVRVPTVVSSSALPGKSRCRDTQTPTSRKSPLDDEDEAEDMRPLILFTWWSERRSKGNLQHHINTVGLPRPSLLIVLLLPSGRQRSRGEEVDGGGSSVRKESAEWSTASPDALASIGRPRVGRVPPEECRRLPSLLCGQAPRGCLAAPLGLVRSQWGGVVRSLSQNHSDDPRRCH